MRTMSASEFKAKCLKILDEVAQRGESVVILKRGRPVAELNPATKAAGGYPQDSLLGTVETLGDVVGPALPADAWEAEGGGRA